MNADSKPHFDNAAIAFLDREPTAIELDDLRRSAREDIDARSRIVMQVLRIAGFKFIDGTYEFQISPPHPDYHSTVFTREPDAHDPDERIFKLFYISTDLDQRLPEIASLQIHAGIDGFTLQTLRFDAAEGHTADKDFSTTGVDLPLKIAEFLRPYTPNGADRIMDLRIRYGKQVLEPVPIPA